MRLIKIIRTPKAEVTLTREDVRLIEECTKLHYDAESMRGLLNRLKIYVGNVDSSSIVFEFSELDLYAKMLEKYLDLSDNEDRLKAYALRNQIGDLLGNLNRQYEADNESAAIMERAEERDRTSGGEAVPFPSGGWDEENEEDDDCDY